MLVCVEKRINKSIPPPARAVLEHVMTAAVSFLFKCTVNVRVVIEKNF